MLIIKIKFKKNLSELVIAAMHDVGVLSIQERNILIQEDVNYPNLHCVMGYKMLAPFNIDLSTLNRTQNFEQSFPESLNFGTKL